jgi:glycosyltransferase involved in cell wall biosynthesis
MPAVVHQVLVTLHQGDAMGNEALAIRGLLRRAGCASEIFAERIDARLRGAARDFDAGLLGSDPEALWLFHYSAGGSVARRLLEAPGRLVLAYHNLTPAGLVAPWDADLARQLAGARALLGRFASRVERALAKSEYSRRELEDQGFPRTAVLPFVLDVARYREPPAPVLRRLLADGRPNLLFVGRVVPNKRIEDLIQVAAALRSRIGPRFRLVVAGDTGTLPLYAGALEGLAEALGVREQVLFTGHVEEAELRALYGGASVFLCLSEHEGFGVPLQEAMLFGVPVVAFDAGAVRETLGGAGVLLAEKAPEAVAGLVAMLLEDAALRAAVLATQDGEVRRLRRTDFGALLQGALFGSLRGASLEASA